MIIFSGIADEAGREIGTQIRAHQELGWDHIELRLVNGKNVAGELPDREFDRVREELEAHGMKVTGFASRIGNWSRHIRGDFQLDLEDLRIALPRMKALQVGQMRVMGWKGDGVPETEWFQLAVSRMQTLADMAAEWGVNLDHENCEGWGGLSARHMLEFHAAVNRPNFRLLYDLGNVISHGDEPWPFFETLRHHFSYIHIKDARKNPQGGRSNDYAYCGEGDALLKEILTKILAEDCYDGVLSIEPHIAQIVHLSNAPAATPEAMYASYVRYGRMFMRLIGEIQEEGRK